MFAIIEHGSHQLRVEQGQTVTIDYRAESTAGDAITFDRVLLANGGGASALGHPTIDGAAVEGQVVSPLIKGPKLEVQKLRRRKNSRRHTGHRQKFTTVLITAINVPGLEVVETPEPEETPEPVESATPSDDAGATEAAEDTSSSTEDED